MHGQARKTRKHELTAEQRERAMRRTMRMRELEEQRQRARPSIEEELEARRRGNPLLDAAQEKLDENQDEVKALTMMLNTMKVKSVLDVQVKEQDELKQQEEEDEKAWHAIELVQAREAARKEAAEREERRRLAEETRQMLLDQVAQREREKMLDQERREQEGQLMVHAIQKVRAAQPAALCARTTGAHLAAPPPAATSKLSATVRQ